MSLAHYASPAHLIAESLNVGKKGQLLAGQPNLDTISHISGLLRRGVLRGIGIQWTLRLGVGVKPTASQLSAIADQFEEGFNSGEVPISWRIDVYT